MAVGLRMIAIFILTPITSKFIDRILARAPQTYQTGHAGARLLKIVCHAYKAYLTSACFVMARFIRFRIYFVERPVSATIFNGFMAIKSPKLLDSSRSPC
ncbi:MAG: hypothetical protein L0229_27170 [Blastocatellia bacterium]|nr:hypothetical protein [Blastocatellia bacterium]